jgi:predicted metal-dependent phosphoesterase TrpH
VRIDLHTHSDVSDGTQTPDELVRAAKAVGLDVVAITDHDTSVGWDLAAETARRVGITLVRGMEISTRHLDRSVHLLAYLPDPTYPPLVAALDRVLDGRNARVPRIVARLRARGCDITVADVLRHARGAAATGRPHVADALVAAGEVRDRDEAFDLLLGAGRPAYVERYAEPLLETIRTVAEAGGVSVLAHPWGRTGPAGLPEAEIATLTEAGLSGLEVDHQDHDAATRDRLRGIARNLDLVATGSSDHHGTGKVGHDLGCNTTDVEQYHRLVQLAADAARGSGRPAPEVLEP